MGSGEATRIRAESVLRHCCSRGVRQPRDDCARSAPQAVPRIRRHLHARVDRRLEAAVQRGVVPARQASEWTSELVGRPLQLYMEQFERQPVGREQHLRVAHESPPEQLRPQCRIRHEHLQFAAPDHPRTDRQGARAEQSPRPGVCAGRGMDGVGHRRARERLAVERGNQQRHVGCQPRPLRRPAAAESDRGSEYARERRRTGLDSGQSGRPVLQRERIREPRRWAVRQCTSND